MTRGAPRLLAANPADGRTVVNVGTLLGLHTGDNPHRWYDPADVQRVATAITRRPQTARPSSRSLLRAAPAGLPDHRPGSLPRAHRHHPPAATPASRSGPRRASSRSMAPSLGLRLLTPASFMRAVSEGTEVTVRRHRHRRASDHQPGDQGVDREPTEPDPRDPASRQSRPRGRHPDRDRDRDADAGQRQLRAVADRSAQALAAALRRATKR